MAETDPAASTPATETAPAVETVSTQPATEAAVASDDPRAFKAARTAERLGKPLADVPAPADATVETRKTRQQKDQDRINESIRAGIDAATAPLRAELETLKAAPRAIADVARPAAASVATPGEPAWKKYAAMPDAPRLKNFESVEDHAAAMALFVADTRHAERVAETARHAETEDLTTAQRARVETFVGRLNETKTADPEFITKLSPAVKALKPFSALAPGEMGGPLNVLTEQIFDSPIAPKVLLHLSQHPEALQKFATMPPGIAALPPAVRVKAHTEWIVREFGKLEGSLESPAAAAAEPAVPPKTVTSAPEPAPVLGSRPAAATDPVTGALERDDPRAYKLAMLAKRRR